MVFASHWAIRCLSGGVGAADWHADGCVHEEEGVRLRCHDVVKDASEVRARGDAPSRAAKARGCEVVRHDQVEERDCDGAARNEGVRPRAWRKGVEGIRGAPYVRAPNAATDWCLAKRSTRWTRWGWTMGTSLMTPLRLSGRHPYTSSSPRHCCPWAPAPM